ncbi:PEPxxWA-CTERM sorting domain-containing protein [Sphingomonas sp.]|uniref:PEPxxWA-CTERM sorting domain-containing protein n=1 Tax=Sphingomonas sp. TaxID=28214 RepID=UPI000DB29589|nr:PEPxxWA-CTERM sorting domain-containing protein [Sphingomonas sp.]PZU10360.1 MAG: hypothetical protein DI605_07240 [Sphingomonas sp.]
MTFPAIRKLGLIATGLIGSATLAAGADAAVTITGVALDSPGGVNGTITYTPSNPDYVANAAIGRIRLTTSTGDTLLSYCIDIFHNLTTGTFTGGTVASAITDAGKVTKLSALLSNGEALVTDADHSAAQQLAVWEIINEGSGVYNLGAGDFFASNISANAVSLANSYLANVNNGVWAADPSLSLAVLTSPNNQTQLVFGASAAKVLGSVPEPATWAMMLIGFGAIGGTMRARRTPIRPVVRFG